MLLMSATFSRQARGSSTTDTDLILNVRKITAWLEEQHSRMLLASTKVYSLSAAIKHIHHIYSPSKQSPDFVHRCSNILTELAGLAGWQKSLRKSIKQANTKQHIEEVAVDEAPDALSALHSQKVQMNVAAAMFRLQKQFSNDNAKLLQSYIAAIVIYSNAQLPRVVTNMTRKEYQNRDDQGYTIVISAVNHKTVAQGPADLALE